jgi:hypothetical protein
MCSRVYDRRALGDRAGSLAHNYERLKQVPSDETNGVTEIGDQYARETRASFALPTGSARRGTTPAHIPDLQQVPCF